ncbi:MAG: mechanosensitive ion channel [Methanotrichaceae archaeon]|nr:mechanosensitive ion channel [Methanotrichaceae archaeon]
MLRRFAFIASLLLLAALFWTADYYYPQTYLQKAFLTLVTVSAVHLVFKHLVEEELSKRIFEAKTKYSFRKTISILYLVVLTAIVLNIWVENSQSLLVSYGIIAAGLAVALQDIFKNFMGGVIIFLTGMYQVGDRIEIDNKRGDVIDIDIFYTTLLELGEWMSGDQATGRLVIIPNGRVLSGNLSNYTKDHNFLWDEITIPITYESDWRSAHEKIMAILRRETGEVAKRADLELSKLEEKYYLPGRAMDPTIFMTITDNWIEFKVRYVTIVRERRIIKDRLSRLILDEIERSDEIGLASTTIDIVGFPNPAEGAKGGGLS